MSDIESADIALSGLSGGAVEGSQRRARRGRAVGAGCLALVLGLCFGVSVLGFALRSGPAAFSLPGNNSLKLGSDDFVLSDYSFQNGTTYFVDFKGNDVRTILEFRALADKRTLEIVLHHADKDEQRDNRLLTVPMP